MKKPVQTFLALVVVGIGALVAAGLGLWGYMSATAVQLHPSAKDIQSVSDEEPRPEWSGAVTRAREIARDGLSKQNLPGLSVAVAVGNDIVWAEGFGWADIENHVPVQPGTRFRIGSLSTALTSAGAGVLLERKKLDLDAEIQTYVPEYPRKGSPITLEHLMGEVSGLRYGDGDDQPLLRKHCERPLDALSVFKDDALLFEPGTKSSHSAYGWILVSVAIEAASREPFMTFMQREVFDPLGLKGTMGDPGAEPMGERAASYFPRFRGEPTYGVDVVDSDVEFSCYAGADGFLSTPSDLVRFALSMNAGTLLTTDTVRLLQSPQRLNSGEETRYALGWRVTTTPLASAETRTVGGDARLIEGVVGTLATFPERKIVVSVLSNVSFADTPAIARSIAEQFVSAVSP